MKYYKLEVKESEHVSSPEDAHGAIKNDIANDCQENLYILGTNIKNNI